MRANNFNDELFASTAAGCFVSSCYANRVAIEERVTFEQNYIHMYVYKLYLQ